MENKDLIELLANYHKAVIEARKKYDIILTSMPVSYTHLTLPTTRVV